MPALFLAHGTPMNALENNQFTADWQRLNLHTPKPEAILCISAHWQTHGTQVTAQARPATIHDFGGFPQALFNVQYPSAGNLELVKQLQTLIGAEPSLDWGLDHGTWSLLKHLYPNADIPVVQLSLDYAKTAQQHYDLGCQLRGLRDQGVLILGSGNIVHNISKWMSNPNGPIDWATDFNDAIVSALNKHDHQAIINYEQHPYSGDAVPTLEHYAPLLYVIAQQTECERLMLSQFSERNLETCSMTSLRVG